MSANTSLGHEDKIREGNTHRYYNYIRKTQRKHHDFP